VSNLAERIPRVKIILKLIGVNDPPVNTMIGKNSGSYVFAIRD